MSLAKRASLAPNDVHCHHNLGVLHYHRLELDEAIGRDQWFSDEGLRGSSHDLVGGGLAVAIEIDRDARARIEPGANGVRADDGDGLALIARRGDKAGGFTRGVDLGWVLRVHRLLQV